MNWTEKDINSRGSSRPGKVRNIAPAHERVFQGRVYHSKAECVYAQELELQRMAKAIIGWDSQIRFPIIVNEQKICTVVVDFQVYHLDGSRECIEVKGWESEVYRIKAKLFRATYPKVKYTVVKVGKQ